MVNSEISDGDPRKDGLITRCADARWTRARLEKNESVFSLSPANNAGVSDTKHVSQGCLRARAILPYLPQGPKFADERASGKEHT